LAYLRVRVLSFPLLRSNTYSSLCINIPHSLRAHQSIQGGGCQIGEVSNFDVVNAVAVINLGLGRADDR